MLRKSPVLAGLCNQARDDTLDLSHISESTAHVLVHHLYTGTYQSLEAKKTSPTEGGIAKFESALSVYAVSRAYALPDLETAAKSRIKRLGKDLPASDRLSAAREAYPDPGEDETWFLAYLKTCIRALSEAPSGSLRYDALKFLGPVSMFTKAIVKSAIEISWEDSAIPRQLYATGNRYSETEGYELVSTPSTQEDQEHEPAASRESKQEAINACKESTRFGASLVSTTGTGLAERRGKNVAPLDMPCEPVARLPQDRTPRDFRAGIYVEANLPKPVVNPRRNHKAVSPRAQVQPVVLTEDGHFSARTGEPSRVTDGLARTTVEVSCQQKSFPFFLCSLTLIRSRPSHPAPSIPLRPPCQLLSPTTRILLHRQTFTS